MLTYIQTVCYFDRQPQPFLEISSSGTEKAVSARDLPQKRKLQHLTGDQSEILRASLAAAAAHIDPISAHEMTCLRCSSKSNLLFSRLFQQMLRSRPTHSTLNEVSIKEGFLSGKPLFASLFLDTCMWFRHN